MEETEEKRLKILDEGENLTTKKQFPPSDSCSQVNLLFIFKQISSHRPGTGVTNPRIQSETERNLGSVPSTAPCYVKWHTRNSTTINKVLCFFLFLLVVYVTVQKDRGDMWVYSRVAKYHRYTGRQVHEKLKRVTRHFFQFKGFNCHDSSCTRLNRIF